MKINDQKKELRRALMWVVPMAEEIIGAYPPEQAEQMRMHIRKIKSLIRATAPKRK